jgi:hypothetical protein
MINVFVAREPDINNAEMLHAYVKVYDFDTTEMPE